MSNEEVLRRQTKHDEKTKERDERVSRSTTVDRLFPIATPPVRRAMQGLLQNNPGMLAFMPNEALEQLGTTTQVVNDFLEQTPRARVGHGAAATPTFVGTRQRHAIERIGERTQGIIK